MTEPTPGEAGGSIFTPGAERVVPPRLRALLYVAAGVLVTVWLVIQLYGAGGFFALVAALGVARLVYRWRRSLNTAFASGLVVFLVLLLLWGSLLADRWEEATSTPTPPVVTGP